MATDNVAVALLANTGATVAALAVLIALLGPISGAHFNPAVSLVQTLRGGLPWRDSVIYAGKVPGKQLRLSSEGHITATLRARQRK